MSKIKFSRNEVLAFVEEKVLDETASDEELEFYQDYKWSGSINKNNYTYKKIIYEMGRLYRGE